MKHGKIYVIAAPSGAGKSTLVNALCNLDNKIQLSISHTTRPQRNNEADGVNYYFTSVAEFRKMIDNNEFIEYAQVYDNYYGTNINTIKRFLATGKDIILEIDWQGARQIRKLFPDAVLIFIVPPSLEILAERLNKRNTDSQEVIKKRLDMALDDISHAGEFDHIIINDNFETALQDLWSVMLANRNKTEQILPQIAQQFNFAIDTYSN